MNKPSWLEQPVRDVCHRTRCLLPWQQVISLQAALRWPLAVITLMLVSMVCSAAFTAAEARDIRTEQVRFKGGQTDTSIKGKIVGYDTVSYVLGAEAGQTMTVALNPSNLATYFNVYEPGKKPGDQALANSGMTGPMIPDLNKFSGKLPSSGQYTIFVYMMRSAARRKEVSRYTLDISISPLGDVTNLPPVQNDYADGLQGGPDFWDVSPNSAAAKVNIRDAPSGAAPLVGNLAGGTVVRNRGCRMVEGLRWCRVETIGAPLMSGWTAGKFLRESNYAGSTALEHDALVPGTKYHATGDIPCARYAGQLMHQCRFGVVRKGQGNGAVTVFWPDGGNRVILFENGKPASFDQLQADGDARMSVSQNADLFTVTIGTQRFEIPDAVINGG
jgi:hypothetical protein